MLRVTDPGAVRWLQHARVRGVLGAFQGRANTTARAAAALHLDVRVVHRDVGRLLNAGLLRVEREVPRAGRPVRHYRAVADAFFVPFTVTDALSAAHLSERDATARDAQFRAAFTRAFEVALGSSGAREWGLRVYFDGRTSQADEGFWDADLREPLTGWQGPDGLYLQGAPEVRLTPAQAQAAQVDLIRLMMRLHAEHQANERAGRGAPFLLRVGLAPVDPRDVHVPVEPTARRGT
ncbi:hypothetical protein Deima_0059 [Deinococcus maricopensis DSM 21211]|uniref:Uncharacterized protein n=1 Tax=Deinococcus maricopensis (strain DSM 21211 / LMG 22137 / NRRL B-23946 / LB-34) TaxID=709986 RepID=E8U2Y5_DEIML|nr:hypothetical protein Deima_0059 [Deinococcus maricopensis DSM 21211]